jgi:hypothetical protein
MDCEDAVSAMKQQKEMPKIKHELSTNAAADFLLSVQTKCLLLAESITDITGEWSAE